MARRKNTLFYEIREKGPPDDFFPIPKQSKKGIDKYIFKNDKMIRQHYNPNQNKLCSLNNVSGNFAYGPSINHYRGHQNHYIIPVNEEDESDNSDHYTEIRFDDEKESDQEMDFRKEF